jgi:glutaredoxin 3
VTGTSDADSSRVVVYTTDPCSFCIRAKLLLEARGIPYHEEHLVRTAEGRTRLAEVAPDARTFPQIVIDGELIGGYRELVAYDRNGRLAGLKS